MDQAITRAAGATPRAVGEFEGFVDGEPFVRWIDRKNMPNVGDMLFAAPGRALQHTSFPTTIWDVPKLKPNPRSWSILLTSENHGTVGPIGSAFPHAGEKHERVQVMEIVEAGSAPAPGVDLAGLVRLDLASTLSDVAEWVRQLPIPTRGACTAMRKLHEVKAAIATPSALAGAAAPQQPGLLDSGASLLHNGGASVDTPEFRDLLARVWNGWHPKFNKKDVAAVIAHIDQHVASQVRAAQANRVLESDIREAMRLAEKGHGSSWINYDGNKLATVLEDLIGSSAISHSGEGEKGGAA